MRTFILLLVLLNVALFGYFSLDKFAPKKVTVHKELNPKKLKLVMDNDFSGLSKKQVTSSQALSCYKWSGFNSANLAAAQEMVASLGLEGELLQEGGAQQGRRFWVYYPPLPNAERAQKKAAEIKRLGVKDLHIVQDEKWKNAISFGLFNKEPLATNLLKDLREMGVKHAAKSTRNLGKTATSLVAKAVSTQAALELYKVTPQFVGTEVKEIPCQ